MAPEQISPNYPAASSPGAGVKGDRRMAASTALISNSYRVLLADDHERFRQEVRKILEEMPDLKVVGEAGDGWELFEHLKKSPPDLIVMDICMPNFRALEATPRIKKEYPAVKVLIMILDQAPEYVSLAAAAKADGCLLKEEAGTQLAVAIDAIRRGATYCQAVI